ncbi:MAG: hypothetical protein R6X15_04660, partial [Pseudomonadota bacterium]
MGLYSAGGLWNLEGMAAYASTNYANSGTIYTFTFSQAVNMGTIELLTASGSGTTATFSASGHTDVSSGPIAYLADATVVDLSSFTGVTSFTMTPASADQFYFDQITFTAANTAPAISGTSAGQAVNDTGTISPFSSATVADNDGDTVALTVALDTQAKGAFTVASLTSSGFTDNGNGTYSLAATDTTGATNALRALVFDPTENRVAPGSTETTAFTITANDGTDTTSDSTATVVSTSINDVPTNLFLSDATVRHSEGSSNVVVGTASTVDADTGESFTYSLVAGTGDTDNASFNINGDELRANDPTALADGTYSVRIQTNDGDATYSESFGVTVNDDVAPAVTGSAPSGSPSAGDASVDFTVTFDESVSNVTTDDFTLTATGSAAGNIANVTGSGTTYTVTVDTITGEGTLRLDLKSGTDIQDGAGNTPAGYTGGTAHTVDRLGPSVSEAHISLSGASGTGGAFKVGDTVTVTWDDTAIGDNNSDTISAVTVDFSAFGGGA